MSAPIVLPASVEPYEQAQLHARVSGYVGEVLAERGDVVKAGQRLARIELPELAAELAHARAQAAERERLAEAAEVAVSQAAAALEVARRQLERWAADVRLKEATLERQRQLHAEGAVTAQELDEALATTEIARSDFAIGQARIVAAEADRAAADAELAVARSQVSVAHARVALVESTARYLEIVAPFAGVVTERRVSPGDLTRSGAGDASALFTLQRLDIVRIRADVPEHDARRILRGTPAEVRVPALGTAPVAATVTRTSGALEPRTRTLRIEVELPNTSGVWLSGSYVELALTPAAGDGR